ncbi:unnamed protein product [Boreogadus saida]
MYTALMVTISLFAMAVLLLSLPQSVSSKKVFHNDSETVYLGSQFLEPALRRAMELTDAAYTRTSERVKMSLSEGALRPSDLLAQFKQAEPSTRAHIQAAELLDNTVELIREMVYTHTMVMPDHSELLSDGDVEELLQVTGCSSELKSMRCDTDCLSERYRSVTGECNNRERSSWGAANIPYSRWLEPEYEDTTGMPRGWDPDHSYNGFSLPPVRLVSQEVLYTHNDNISLDSTLSHLLVEWGQWIDHDLALTPQSPSTAAFRTAVDCTRSCSRDPPCFPIQIPSSDPRTGLQSCMPFFRSAPSCGRGPLGSGPLGRGHREQLNAITSYVDASMVYGSSPGVASALRDRLSPRGALALNPQHSDHGLAYMPFLSRGPQARLDPCGPRRGGNLSSSGPPDGSPRRDNATSCFQAAGNKRWRYPGAGPVWRPEAGRFPPIAGHRGPGEPGPEAQEGPCRPGRGPSAAGERQGAPGGEAGVSKGEGHAGRTAVYTMLASTYDGDGVELFRWDLPRGPLPRGAAPADRRRAEEGMPREAGGVDPVLRGLLLSPAKLQVPGQMMVEELTERLFQAQGGMPLDLGALNLQRGRDHGLPGYSSWRELCGLSVPNTTADLADVLGNRPLAHKFLELYGTARNIDVWVGAISEPALPGGRVGPLLACLLARQFRALRDGDRFWWEREGVFTAAQRKQLRAASLSRIICDNSHIQRVPADPFSRTESADAMLPCSHPLIPQLDLGPWKEPDTDPRCGVIPRVQYGYSLLCGSVVLFQCRTGFTLQGPPSVRCDPGSKNWTPAPPICHDPNPSVGSVLGAVVAVLAGVLILALLLVWYRRYFPNKQELVNEGCCQQNS